ncbi:hypothetical protein B0H11DRAFT_2399661 [Mycena galericulata]|nr:hypothetical protein B0H11DRAFT_2399661 [Mycena galericulata]
MPFKQPHHSTQYTRKAVPALIYWVNLPLLCFFEILTLLSELTRLTKTNAARTKVPGASASKPRVRRRRESASGVARAVAAGCTEEWAILNFGLSLLSAGSVPQWVTLRNVNLLLQKHPEILANEIRLNLTLIPRLYDISQRLDAGCGTIANRPFLHSMIPSTIRESATHTGIFALRKQGPPLAVLKKLGSFSEDPILDGSKRPCITQKNNVLVNTSGSGKTWLLFEGLCREWVYILPQD